MALQRLMSRGREDDTPEKIKSRLANYKLNQREILDYFKEKNLLVEINNTDPIPQVQARLKNLLGL